MSDRHSYSDLLEEVGNLKRCIVHIYPGDNIEVKVYDCKNKEHLIIILKQFATIPDTFVKVFPDIKNIYTGLLTKEFPISGILEHFWKTNAYNYREGDADYTLYAGPIADDELRTLTDLYDLCNMRVEHSPQTPFHFLLCNHDQYYKAWQA